MEAERQREEQQLDAAAERSMVPWFPRVAENPSKRFNDAGTGFVIGHALDEAAMREVVAALQWPHYVYVLCSQAGAVFYVGKGSGTRVFDHRKEADSGVQSEKCRVIRALGDRLRYGLYAACQDHDWAVMLESLLIACDYDNLTNIKPGTAASIVAAAYRDPDERELSRTIARLKNTLKQMAESQYRTEEWFMRTYPFMAHKILEGRAEHPLVAID
jgi:hypothetical protein